MEGNSVLVGRVNHSGLHSYSRTYEITLFNTLTLYMVKLKLQSFSRSRGY